MCDKETDDRLVRVEDDQTELLRRLNAAVDRLALVEAVVLRGAPIPEEVR